MSESETCFVCGRPANTKEHLIPKWLQRRFDLWNQGVRLTNGTTIKYRQLVVPACRRCNSETFGALEQRVEAGSATDAELWRWANKIHYGLGLKDQLLAWDRRHGGMTIGDVANPQDPIERSRHFLHCASGDFKTNPDPFGSVFRVDFTTYQPFRFAHSNATSSLCVSFGHWGLIVFVVDGQALRHSNLMNDVESRLRKEKTAEDMLFLYAQGIEAMHRFELGINIVMDPGLPGMLARVGSAVPHRSDPPNKERFSAICRALGFTWIDSDQEGGG